MNIYENKIRAAKTIDELCAALTDYCNAADINTFLMGASRYAEAEKKLAKIGIKIEFGVENGKAIIKAA